MVTNAELNQKVTDLLNRVAALERELNELKKSPPVASTPPASAPAASTLPASASNWANHLFNSREKPSVEMQNVVSAVKIDMKEEAHKMNNIMVFGLESSKASKEEDKSQDDLTRVEQILTTCGMREVYKDSGVKPIISVQRIKLNNPSSAEKPPPIIVKMTGFDYSVVPDILKNAKNLKNSEWNGVFVAPDLTRLDREFGKRLRNERDKLNNDLGTSSPFRYGIRGRQVVKIMT